jgi:SpoVK/Ycf46/Vps4 family AAA+-type ATPase
MREAMQSAPIEELVANHEKGEALTLRAMVLHDFEEATNTIKPSYGPEMLEKYQAWAEQYGTEDSQKTTEQCD